MASVYVRNFSEIHPILLRTTGLNDADENATVFCNRQPKRTTLVLVNFFYLRESEWARKRPPVPGTNLQ